jgi:hypothetical protein
MSKRTIAATTQSRKSPSKRSAPKRQVKTNIDDPVVQDWKHMFVIAEHWKSDLDFFVDELNFFRKLLDKYLFTLIDEKHIGDTLPLVTSLKQFEKKRIELERKVNAHLTKLTDLVQNPFAQDSQLSMDLHSKLEGSMVDFAKNFRSLKKEVFRLSEDAMESNKAKHLLGS